MDATEFRVMIIGAGSTGLVLAQGLRAANIAYTVYERDSENALRTRSRDWGMSCHWGGQFLSECLPAEIRDRIREVDCDPFYDFSSEPGFVMCNGKTAETILVMPGTSPKRISRKKLRELMQTDIDIKYDKKLVEISTTDSAVTAKFEDGSSASGSLIVGCDGSNSRVREIMVGTEAAKQKISDVMLMNFPYTYDAATSKHLRTIHPVFKIACHPELNSMYLLSILDVPDPEDPASFKFQNLVSWKGPPFLEDLQEPAVRMKLYKDRGAQFAEPWRSAALGVAEDMILPVERARYWIPAKWDNADGKRRFTLAGDAAHPMLPHRGQGLNNSLQDASSLLTMAKSVASNAKSLEEALATYEDEMIPRAQTEIPISLKQAEMIFDWDKFMTSPMFKIGTHKAPVGQTGN